MPNIIDAVVTKLLFKKPQEEVYSNLDRMFSKKKNSWNYSKSEYELRRHKKIIEFVKQIPHKTILEVGCAEGHLAKKLTEISAHVTAIDVSPIAVKRAQINAPKAKVKLAKLEDFKIPKEKFDVIVCADVLCYLKDKEAVVTRIEELGNYLVMSNGYVFPFLVEPYFFRFKLLKRSLVANLKEGRTKFASITAWKLS